MEDLKRLRHGLSYSQAAQNCNVLAKKAYEKALVENASIKEAQAAADKAFCDEMNWYES